MEMGERLHHAMTIRYQNTFRDLMAFCCYHYPRSPVIIGFNGACFALISFLVFYAFPLQTCTLMAGWPNLSP